MPGDKLTSDIHAFREAALSCPIPAAVELIGEKWAFLILRGEEAAGGIEVSLVGGPLQVDLGCFGKLLESR